MSRTILHALARFSGALAVLALNVSVALAAPPDPRTAAIQAATKRASGCDDCFFFALPTRNALIQKHDLFVVSTLDRLPPPFWTVAVPKKGEPLLLDVKNPDDWNELIRSEKLTLKLDADVENYVKAFLELAVGRALLASDKAPLQILRQKRLLSVSFHAKDALGTLQQWDLLLESDGTLLKTAVK